MIAQNATPSTTAGISPRTQSRSGDAPFKRFGSSTDLTAFLAPPWLKVPVGPQERIAPILGDSAPRLTGTDASRRKAHAEWARRYRAESGL